VLVNTNVISSVNAGDIRDMTGYNDRARKLIDVLMKKPNDAFDGFSDALNQTGQSHVTYLLTGNGNSHPLKEEYRNSLLANKRDYLVNTIDSTSSGLISTLMTKGVISDYDQQRVTGAQSDTAENRNEIMLNLIVRKSQSDFFKFISALTETDQAHVVLTLIGGKVIAKAKSVYERETDAGRIRNVDAQLLEYIRQMFENSGDVVRRLTKVLSNHGVTVSDIRDGCIEFTFTCENAESVQYLLQLCNSGKLAQMMNEAFCPHFASKGLKSLDLAISDQPMTSEHHQALLSQEKWLVGHMRINDDLLNRLSLCRRRRQAIKQATPEQQVKTLIDIISRGPDSAFTQLFNALKATNQHEAADIISWGVTAATKTKASE